MEGSEPSKGLVQGFILSLGSLLNDQRLSDVQWRKKKMPNCLYWTDWQTFMTMTSIIDVNQIILISTLSDCGFLLARSLHFAIWELPIQLGTQFLQWLAGHCSASPGKFRRLAERSSASPGIPTTCRAFLCESGHSDDLQSVPLRVRAFRRLAEHWLVSTVFQCLTCFNGIMTANGTNTFLSHQRKICSTCRWRGYGDPSFLRLSGNNDLQGKGIGINFNLQVEGVGNPLHLQVQTPYQTHAPASQWSRRLAGKMGCLAPATCESYHIFFWW